VEHNFPHMPNARMEPDHLSRMESDRAYREAVEEASAMAFLVGYLGGLMSALIIVSVIGALV